MIILDTDVFSELMKPDPDAHVSRWLGSVPHQSLFTTVITRAEVRRGIERLSRSRRRTRLDSAATAMFEEMSARVLDFEATAAERCGVLVAARDAAGSPIGPLDAQIASIAHVHGATLATRNTRDFEGCGIPLANPFMDR